MTDPRPLGGGTAVITDTANMALVIAIGWDGAADVRAHIPKPQAAELLRQIADQFDPPATEGETTS